MKLTVYGTSLSPWVRRLMVFIQEKGLDYEMVNVVPMGDPDPEFLKISPLGKVPVLEVDGRYMPDSLAGCVFLENELGTPSLFPTDGWDLGQMHWLCDFLGTAVFSKVEAPLFIQRFINPNFLKVDPDQAVIDDALALMPGYYNYLEGRLGGGHSYLVGDVVSLADLTAGSIFINLLHAGEPVDQTRWPNLSAYVSRLLERPSFTRILEMEKETIGALSPMFAS